MAMTDNELDRYFELLSGGGSGRSDELSLDHIIELAEIVDVELATDFLADGRETGDLWSDSSDRVLATCETHETAQLLAVMRNLFPALIKIINENNAKKVP